MTGLINRKPVFDAVRQLRGGKPFTLAEVSILDAGIDAGLAAVEPQFGHPPPCGRQVSQRGIDLIHSFESCKLDAYKDPGSKNGLPITIGWGSTSTLDGRPIQLGDTWTQAECDARFADDLAKFSAKVEALLGDTPTDQSQFDALVSFSYNVGTDALRKSTLLRKHKAGDHAGAAAQFAKWIFNDGKPLRGLVRRRAAEAALYLADEEPQP